MNGARVHPPHLLRRVLIIMSLTAILMVFEVVLSGGADRMFGQ